jgi:hypothetical protein
LSKITAVLLIVLALSLVDCSQGYDHPYCQDGFDALAPSCDLTDYGRAKNECDAKGRCKHNYDPTPIGWQVVDNIVGVPEAIVILPLYVVGQIVAPTPTVGGYPCAENGSCYGDISDVTGLPKTNLVSGYFRSDGTYVRGYYRSP